MKEFMKKGISTLPVVNEILFFVLLAHEVVGIIKNWCKNKSSNENNPDEKEPEKK